jgi:hypothetical protein
VIKALIGEQHNRLPKLYIMPSFATTSLPILSQQNIAHINARLDKLPEAKYKRIENAPPGTMYKKKPREVIYTRDLEIILDRSSRTASRMMKKIRTKLGEKTWYR